MDMRNGDLYPSREAAQAAGVPDEQLAEVDPVLVHVTSGPFKGRVYQRTASGLQRDADGEARAKRQEELIAELSKKLAALTEDAAAVKVVK